MSIPKIMGIETEYGITVKNAPNQDPVGASTLVVNSYKNDPKKIMWDYAQENPLMDARGFQSEGENDTPDQNSNYVINDILANGGRYYVDHAHPEYCTPECATARDLVVYEKAGEVILDVSRTAAEETLPTGQEILIYKNNSDRKGHSYGCHENYLVDRKTPFQNIVEGLIPFLVTRQIFTGSGKIGSEANGEPAEYQLSQRADFFETEVGLSTMVDRPIINTRDEPHADEKLYRRLHVIIGDANMAEYSEYLKVGTTALVLALIEDDKITDRFKLQEPVKSLKEISRDIDCKKKIKLADGRELTAIEIQREYWELATSHLDNAGVSPATKDVLDKWVFVLDKLEESPSLLDRYLDWVIKRNLIEAYRSRHKLPWDDRKIMMMDLQYHDIRPARGIYHQLLKNNRIERIVSDEEIIHAVTHPPIDTRAYFRGICLKRFSQNIHNVSWNSMTFSIDDSQFDRVPMPHPQRGTKAIIGELLDNCSTAAELIDVLDETSNTGESEGQVAEKPEED